MKLLPFKNLTLFLTLLSVLFGCHPPKEGWDSQTWTSGKNLTKVMSKKGIYEMSGLHWNPISHRLYAIQDNGDLRILQLDTITNKFSQLALVQSLGGPEGITQVDYKTNEFYIIDEKTCEINRYTHNNDFSTVTFCNKWDLSAPPSNMTLTGSEGPEGIVFVPDRYLKKIGFISSETNEKYLSTKGMHGLMFIAHQRKGLIWVYDINPTKNDDMVFVGKYATNRKESCDLSFDRSTGLLYILHNIDNNSVEVTDLSTELISGKYHFVKKQEYNIPNPSGSQNIEGFAISPKFDHKIGGNVWLCRDIDNNTKSHDRKDCLRWFNYFDCEGTLVKNWKEN